MRNSKLVAVIAALSILFSVPCATLASAKGPVERDQSGVVKGPMVATSAMPLSDEEMARYAQMQSEAAQKGVLQSEKGGVDATTWTVVGIAVMAAVFIGLAVAIADAD